MPKRILIVIILLRYMRILTTDFWKDKNTLHQNSSIINYVDHYKYDYLEMSVNETETIDKLSSLIKNINGIKQRNEVTVIIDGTDKIKTLINELQIM